MNERDREDLARRDGFRVGVGAALEAMMRQGPDDGAVWQFKRNAQKAMLALAAPPQVWAAGERVTVEYDGFTGDVIGHYTTREGKQGVVVQQDGTKVVHVYGRARVTTL
jgi:hypothetical protein